MPIRIGFRWIAVVSKVLAFAWQSIPLGKGTGKELTYLGRLAKYVRRQKSYRRDWPANRAAIVRELVEAAMHGLSAHLDTLITLAPVLQVPLPQVLLFVALICIVAAFERYRLLLILSYVFAVYWVFIENLKQLAANEATAFSVVIFLVFGLLALFLFIYHSVSSRDD